MVAAQDDFRHDLAPGPHARESMFHTLVLAKERIVVCTYTWVDAGNRAGYLFVVSGEMDERRAFGGLDGVDIGAADFGDWRVGGLHLRHTDALRTAEMEVELDGISFRAAYEAMHPAFSYRENRDGCPPYAADDRFEQACRVQGVLWLDGREIVIDTTGQRDHSWGRRDWATFQDWKWISAQAGPELAVNVMVSHARGETSHNGYVFRDGVVTPVVHARIAAEYDDRFRQRSADVDVTDESGRVTRLALERFACFGFEAGTQTLLNEAGCSATIGGVAAVVHFECGWDAVYAATQASRAAQLA